MSCQALYDFDGTLTSKDTTVILLMELVKLRPWRFIGMTWFLLGMILARRSKSKQAKKNRAIGYLIQNLDNESVSRAVASFSAKVTPLYRQAVLVSMRESIQEGCTALIVTASPSFAVRGCLPHQSILVVGTEFEKDEHTYTGKLLGENCYGAEKVSRIKEWAASNKMTLNVKTAWSDHLSDFEMLSLAKERYWLGEEKLREQVIRRDPRANFF